MRPVLDRDPSPLDAPKTRVPVEREWNFSLKYWRQIDKFGVGDQGQAWFISLLNRLQELGKISVDKFLQDSQMREVCFESSCETTVFGTG